ncbi:MAG: GldM family protein [Chitinophagales bacterium]
MKKTIVQFAICFFYFAINAYAQKETIIFDKISDNNYLYQNFPISFTIKNEENDCEAIYLTSNNGTITKSKCNYRIIANEQRQTDISIFKIIEKDTVFLAKKRFYVKEVPLPTTEVGGKNRGTMKVGEMKAQMGVVARLKYFPVDVVHKVTKYRILLMRGEKLIGTHWNVGTTFNEEAVALLREIKPKDKVYFVDVYAKNYQHKELKLNAVEFEIVE